MVNLLCRFYEYDQGSITIDDRVDIARGLLEQIERGWRGRRSEIRLQDSSDLLFEYALVWPGGDEAGRLTGIGRCDGVEQPRGADRRGRAS